MSPVVFNENKGPSRRGMKATRDFATNELIKVYKPDFVSTGRPVLSSRLSSAEVIVFQLFLETRKSPRFERKLDYYTTHYDVKHDEPMVDYMTENVMKLIPSPQSETLIRKLCCLVLINGFNIHMQDLDAEGEGFSFDYAMLNHSCAPNTFTVPMGDRFALVSNRPIHKGTEITTSYCFGSFPKFIRRYSLQTQFHFTCKCNLCTNRKDYFFSYDCPHCKCHLMNVDLYDLLHKTIACDQCHACGESIDNQVLQFAQKQHRLLILNMMYDAEEPSNCDFNLESVQTIIRQLPAHSVEDYVAKRTTTSKFDCPERKLNKVKNVIFELLSTGFVPAYCYPLDIYISRITAEKVWFFSWQDQLQLYLADSLLVAFPQIISPYKYNAYSQMRVLSVNLLLVRTQVEERQQDLRNSLAVASYYLVRGCLMHMLGQVTIQQMLQDKSLYDLLKLTQDLMERNELENETFPPHFQRVLQFAGISLRFSKQKFMVQYATRTYGYLI